MIEVREYDDAWPERFERLRDDYAAALDAAGVPVAAIEHVGSTSVPGLAAKPVIDIDVVVAAGRVEAASAVLVDLGFESRGEVGVPQRWAFWEPERLRGTNTYVVVEGCLALRNHLAVRDVLRRDDALRDDYGAVKMRVGATAADIHAYGAGKTAMVERILAASDLTLAERAEIAGHQVPVTHRPGP